MAARAESAPPPPEVPLVYPILFSENSSNNTNATSDEAHTSDKKSVSLFNAPAWLWPLYGLAGWADKPSAAAAAAAPPAEGAMEEEVRTALATLPLLQPYFTIESKLIPQHEAPYYYVADLTVPTPKGSKTITRSKVEGDYAAHYTKHIDAGRQMQFTTVTNSTAYFSLLPGQNHFLVFYEAKERLRHFSYVQLDQLRFCWVAMQELLTEHKLYNLSDGSLTGFARRDLKKNNSDSPFAKQSTASTNENENDNNNNNNNNNAEGKVIGKGGGNARRNQGNANNAIVAPKKEVLERKKEMQQKSFMKEELLQYCATRWPHTPSHKSCLFTLEECIAAELPEEVQKKLDLVGKFNQTNNKKRRGPTFYLATVEFPLLSKKGSPPVRYKIQANKSSDDCGWYNNRKDAENAVAEVALLGIRNIK